MENIVTELYNGVEIIVGEYLAKAGYDRTIQATILKCEDTATGKYSLKYQDSKIYAYASTVDVVYDNNTVVYVLIPNNNMSAHKTILGAVKNQGVINNNVIPESSKYIVYGSNLIELKKDFGLCSYYSNEDSKDRREITIYDYTDTNLANKEDQKYIIETNNVRINLAEIQKNLTLNNNADRLRVGGCFKTNLPSEQQYNGNYGLKIKFIGKQEDTDTIREFIMSVDQMTGDPYKYFIESEQTSYIDISDYTIIGIKSIIFYDERFPVAADEEKSYNNDIFLKNVIIQSCEKIPDAELLAPQLRLKTLYGTTFFPSDLDSKELPIIAEVWNNGRVVAADSNSLGYYWFEEKAEVKKYLEDNNSLNPDYDLLGGNGWKCLSPIISTGGHSADSNTLKIKKSDLKMYSKKFMSVAVYNAQKFTKDFTLVNLDANFKIELTTDVGKQIFLKTETADIKVNVNIYYRQNQKQGWIKELPVSVAKIKWYYEDQWGNYKVPDRVAPDNKYVIISLADFNSSLKLLCDVTLETGIYGTESIVLTKVASSNEPYTLEIINNNQIFVYDEEGVSPASEKNLTPIQIQPLTFQIYDNRTGTIIEAKDIAASKTLWQFPLPDVSLINSPAEDGTLQLRGQEMSFTLDDTYNYLENANNSIMLDVEYHGEFLRAKTNITCIKQGDNGTNGTGYSIKIIPIEYSTDGSTDGPWFKENTYLPIVPFVKSGNKINPALLTNTKHWFDVALFFEGQKIFQNSRTGDININENIDTSDTLVKVKWEFKKHDQRYWSEDSFYEVTENGEFSIKQDLPYIDFTEKENQNYCHIVQVSVTYKGKTLIATQSIGTLIAEVAPGDNSKNDIYLKTDTGFREVIYKADGSFPKYTKCYPFQIIEKDTPPAKNQVIDNLLWTTAGVYGYNNDLIESEDLKQATAFGEDDLQLVPNDIYSGICLTNAAIATSTDKKLQIHLPIHFYLNRYANKAINGWDGNSININEEDGVILTPQIGAGKKEEDNSFTGVIMGVSKTNKNEDVKDEVGIFGFNHGNRTLFIDSEDGSASFGVASIGSIDIKPAVNQYGEIVGEPVIQSGNYKEKGSGLSIGFGNDPYIYYGNKKFMVNQDGALTANGATINGKFTTRNLNSWDQSNITIGVENERDESEILLYGYKSNPTNEEATESDRYVTSKTHIAPGILDLSLYKIEDYENPPDLTKKAPTGLPQAYSYLRFENGNLNLKGNFECVTESKSADVSFQNDSSKTWIHFKDQEETGFVPIDELKQQIKNLQNQQKIFIEQARNILLKENNGDITQYGTTNDICHLIEKWYNSISDENNVGYLSDRIDQINKLFDLLSIISNIQNEIDNIQNTINYYKEQIILNDESIVGYNKQIKEYEEDQQTKGRKIIDIKKDEVYKYYITSINTIEQKTEELKNEIEILQKEQNGIKEKRDNIDIYKQEIKSCLFELNVKIYTEEEYALLDEDFKNKLERYEEIIFDAASLLNEKDSSLIPKTTIAINYMKIEKQIQDIKDEIEQRKGKDAKYRVFAESKWSTDEFYFKTYENQNGDYGYTEGIDKKIVRSELSYDADSAQLKYIGSLDFQAYPYAKLKMTKEPLSNDPTRNASELYFKTFFSYANSNEPDLDNVQSAIILKAGEFTLESKENINDDMSSIKMKNGKLDMKNIEFTLKTPSSDVAFKKESSGTHIKMYNYIQNEDGEMQQQGFVKLTPSIFQVKAGDSSLYLNPSKRTLNYTGNLSVSSTNGILYMKDSSMAIRFGTTAKDYKNENNSLYNEAYADVPDRYKVTDFSMSPTGFSIKSYGKKKIRNESEEKGFTSDQKDAIALGFSSGVGYSGDDLSTYFNREFIPEDGISLTEGQTEKDFYDNYYSHFGDSSDDYNSQLRKDFGLNIGSEYTLLNDLQNNLNDKDVDFAYSSGGFVPSEHGSYKTQIASDGSVQIIKVTDGSGNYDWENYTNEGIEYSNCSLPEYLSSSNYDMKTPEEAEYLGEQTTWGETSGLSYNSSTGKFRLNGDFSVRNDHGSVLLSDDMMRIMFKTYEKNSQGEDDKTKPKTRMCIAEESFYFYSFGDLPVAVQNTTKQGYSVNTQTNAASKRGITGAIIWRNGVLTIIGTINADSGKIGGWDISESVLTSNSGNAILNGANGTLYLSDGLSNGSTSSAGAVYSEFLNRRSSIRLGEILIEGVGDSFLSQIYQTYIQKVKSAQEVLKNSQGFPEGVQAFEDEGKTIYAVLNEPKAAQVLKSFGVAYGGTPSSGGHYNGKPLSSAINIYQDSIKAAREELINNFDLEKEDVVSQEEGSWTNYGHLLGGYDASDGLLLTTEGQKLKKIKYNIDEKGKVTLNSFNDGEAEPRGLYFGLSFGREDIENKISQMGEGVAENEIIQTYRKKTAEAPVIAISSTQIPKSFTDRYISSFGEDVFSPITDIETEAERKQAGSLNFVIGQVHFKTGSEEETTQGTDYVYGTQVLPHLVKTNDVYLSNTDLLSSYQSNSLSEILKELHSAPDKISYADTVEKFNSIIEKYNISDDIDITELRDNLGTKYVAIIEEWEKNKQVYEITNSTNIDFKEVNNTEKEMICKIWKIVLKDGSGSAENRGVKTLQMLGSNIEIDLSDF